MLARWVLQHCAAGKSNLIHRERLQQQAPESERAFVRRGIDALVAHGLLFEEGKNIGFTAEGREFLAWLDWADTAKPGAATPDAHAVAARSSEALAQDARLAAPRTTFESHTLPGRLETYREQRRSNSTWRRVTMVVALGAMAAAAFVLH